MKVAYVLPFLQRPTGWRSHAIAFLNALRPHVEPVLFVSAEDQRAAQGLFPGDQIFTLPVTQQAFLSSRRTLLQLVDCWRTIYQGRYPDVDLVHSLEAYPTGLVGSWLAGKLRCPHVLTAHGTYGVIWHEKRLDRAAYRQVLRDARRICPVSWGTARLMQQYFGDVLGEDKLHPILNGNSYTQSIPVEIARSHQDPEQPVILTVGDLKPRKGQHISLAAFARVREIYTAAQYWIIGNYQPENPYFQRLQEMVREKDLQGVRFRGVVSETELRASYQSATLFVLTPQQDGLHFEGFGLVYLEAGAYGLPVVGTRSGGVADAVQEGVTGLLVEPEDVEGVAEAILSLLKDPERRRKMGLANRTWAEQLTWERTAKEQLAVYQEILEGERGSPTVPGRGAG